MLAKFRMCKTKDSLYRQELSRARARMQLRLAGALTSKEPAEEIPPAESNRYMIDMLAMAARRIGERLRDPFLQFQAVHLSTNAVATGRLEDALRHCKNLCRLLPTIQRE